MDFDIDQDLSQLQKDEHRRRVRPTKGRPKPSAKGAAVKPAMAATTPAATPTAQPAPAAAAPAVLASPAAQPVATGAALARPAPTPRPLPAAKRRDAENTAAETSATQASAAPADERNATSAAAQLQPSAVVAPTVMPLQAPAIPPPTGPDLSARPAALVATRADEAGPSDRCAARQAPVPRARPRKRKPPSNAAPPEPDPEQAQAASKRKQSRARKPPRTTMQVAVAEALANGATYADGAAADAPAPPRRKQPARRARKARARKAQADDADAASGDAASCDEDAWGGGDDSEAEGSIVVATSSGSSGSKARRRGRPRSAVQPPENRFHTLIKELLPRRPSKRQKVDPDEPLDPEKTTMGDFIRRANASAKRIDAERAAAAKRAAEAAEVAAPRLGAAAAPAALPAPPAPPAEAAPAQDVPQLIIKDGAIVVNPASLQVQAMAASATPLERAAEDTAPVNSLSYLPMSKLTKERWSEGDTEKFYRAVQIVGCDFTMIAKFFSGRTRKQVKNKYLKESKVNAKRMTDAMSGRHTDVAALREMSAQIQSDAAAAASNASGGAASGAGAAGVALPALPVWHDDDEDSCCDGEIVDPFVRNYVS